MIFVSANSYNQQIGGQTKASEWPGLDQEKVAEHNSEQANACKDKVDGSSCKYRKIKDIKVVCSPSEPDANELPACTYKTEYEKTDSGEDVTYEGTCKTHMHEGSSVRTLMCE